MKLPLDNKQNMCGENHEKRPKTSSRRMDDIEALLEWLEFLQITNKILDETTEQLDKEMSVATAPITTNMNR